ncbi:MAG: adenosine kinase, partial [Boseongicola sp.]
GERSMNTYLGVTEHLSPSDIDEAQMSNAGMIYLEGYRFDGPESHAAFAKAITAAKGAGGKVSLTLSDPFCVERHRDAFRAMLRDHVDLLFANRDEIMSMYQTQDYEAAMAEAAGEIAIVACTEGDKGAHILSGEARWDIPAWPVEIADATGAGDAFAGAFLWAHARGNPLERCGQMGCMAASEVISHLGARPEADLTELFRAEGLV